jgi:hypothetical protein
VRQLFSGFDIRVPHPCAFSKGAGFLTVYLISPMFDSDPAFLRARRIQRGRKTRTLHMNGEECGTRKFNPPPKHGNCRECSGEYP